MTLGDGIKINIIWYMYTCIEKKIPQFCEDIKLSYARLVVEIIVHSDQHVLRFVCFK